MCKHCVTVLAPAPWASLVAAATPTPRPSPRFPPPLSSILIANVVPPYGSPPTFFTGPGPPQAAHSILNTAYFAAADFNWTASTSTMTTNRSGTSVSVDFFSQLKNRLLRCVGGAPAANRQAISPS
ncbi:hypothetical protein HYPSUDRAFT_209451 [Hypholoma sublateritium FD-334 SS-4]|uniref:Uncharacterized protein n=1 Tax=Hypholoma sublateritium (strain FD-334 SS-4) TaxID=945553 RepID=A0A0D2KGA2_HYPSF|nr:hypothetical protein HYPSUDRAFT_209451 [Hypholoma sublateritium FD-334 SS-4]